MRVKKTISLDENVIKIAEEQAKKRGLTFSAYITSLIYEDSKGIKKENEEAKSKVDVDLDSAIDNIL